MRDEGMYPANVEKSIRAFSGREWLLSLIKDWLYSSNEKIILLTGEPGTGKSLFASWAGGLGPLPANPVSQSELLEVRRATKALHFCMSNMGGNSPVVAVENIVFQLNKSIPAFGEHFLNALKEKINISSRQEIQQIEQGGTAIGVFIQNLQWGGLSEELIFDLALRIPLKKMYEIDYQEKILLIIDGLDEASTYSGKTTLIRLFSKIEDLPGNVRILITTRPDPRILKYYTNYRSIDLVKDEPVNLNDVNHYISRQLSAINSPNRESIINRISSSSNGNFLFANLLVQEILAADDPIKKFNQIIIPVGLSEYYLNFLNRELGTDDDIWDLTFKPLLGLIAVSYGKGLTTEQLKAIFARDIENPLRKCIQYLVGPIPEGPFSIFHKSFSDFLLSDSSNKFYKIDAKESHQSISSFFINKYSGKWHQCDRYGLQYISQHLLAAKQLDRFEKIMTDLIFIKNRCEAGLLSDVLRDYETYYTLTGNEDEDRYINSCYRFLSNKSHFIRNDVSVFTQEILNSEDKNIQKLAEAQGLFGSMPGSYWLQKSSGTTYQHHSGQIISMAFWGSNRYFAVSTTTMEVWVWDVGSGKLLRRCEQARSVAKSLVVSPDGKLLAAALGGPIPDPLISGLVIWAKDGKIYKEYNLDSDWVYTLHWENNTSIIAGTGLPTGTEAVGRLWRIDIESDDCKELGNFLSERPFILTWKHPNGKSGDVMALAMDGMICEWTDTSISITEEEAAEISLLLMKENDYDEYDRRMNAKRPIVEWVANPAGDKFGYQTVAQMLNHTTLCFLGEPPVDPDFFAWRESKADGIYFLNFESNESYRMLFEERMIPSFVKAVCLTTSQSQQRFAIGDSYGRVFLYNTVSGGVSINQLKRKLRPVTSLCFSEDSEILGVGDADSNVELFSTSTQDRLFINVADETPIDTRAFDEGILLLYRRNLKWASFHNGINWTVEFDQPFIALDFDIYESTAIIIGVKINTEVQTYEYFIQNLNLLEKSILSFIEIPENSLDKLSSFSQPSEIESSDEPIFKKIRLKPSVKGLEIIIGTYFGILILPYFNIEKQTVYELPIEEMRGRKDKVITVMRLGLDKPDVSWEHFSTNCESVIFCAYSDNTDHPRISGQLRLLNLNDSQYSIPKLFNSSISVLDAVDEESVLVGTDNGEAELWSFTGEWQKKGGIKHAVTVVAASFTITSRLACSASRDGILAVWNFTSNEALFKTEVDCQPVSVGFLPKNESVYMIDINGIMHIWNMRN